MNCIKMKVVLGILVLAIISSCTPLKDLKYLQSSNQTDVVTQKSSPFEYKVQSGDNLYIKVYSMDNKSFEFFNGGATQQNYLNNPSSIYLNSFSVNDSGNIQLPMIGSLYVKGQTIDNIRKLVEEKISQYVNHTTVTVKLINFNVTVLGEVTKPGQFTIYNDKATIFDVLGMAGDLTVYGDRKEIRIVRVQDKQTQVHYVDITDANVINSEYYYLLPNDIVYVEPLNAKSYGFATFPIATILSGISTLILVLNFIK